MALNYPGFGGILNSPMMNMQGRIRMQLRVKCIDYSRPFFISIAAGGYDYPFDPSDSQGGQMNIYNFEPEDGWQEVEAYVNIPYAGNDCFFQLNAATYNDGGLIVDYIKVSRDKEYVATLKLGATTASYDMEHPENAVFPTEHITEQLVLDTLQRFVGDIQQIPPVYSACKIEGKRSYHLARRGKEIQLKPKTLHIDEIELLKYDMPEITIRVSCGKGTYIRALARDIGLALESGAHLTALRRTRVGAVRVEDCMDPSDFKDWIDRQEIIINH